MATGGTGTFIAFTGPTGSGAAPIIQPLIRIEGPTGGIDPYIIGSYNITLTNVTTTLPVGYTGDYLVFSMATGSAYFYEKSEVVANPSLIIAPPTYIYDSISSIQNPGVDLPPHVVEDFKRYESIQITPVSVNITGDALSASTEGVNFPASSRVQTVLSATIRTPISLNCGSVVDTLNFEGTFEVSGNLDMVGQVIVIKQNSSITFKNMNIINLSCIHIEPDATLTIENSGIFAGHMGDDGVYIENDGILSETFFISCPESATLIIKRSTIMPGYSIVSIGNGQTCLLVSGKCTIEESHIRGGNGISGLQGTPFDALESFEKQLKPLEQLNDGWKLSASETQRAVDQFVPTANWTDPVHVRDELEKIRPVRNMVKTLVSRRMQYALVSGIGSTMLSIFSNTKTIRHIELSVARDLKKYPFSKVYVDQLNALDGTGKKSYQSIGGAKNYIKDVLDNYRADLTRQLQKYGTTLTDYVELEKLMDSGIISAPTNSTKRLKFQARTREAASQQRSLQNAIDKVTDEINNFDKRVGRELGEKFYFGKLIDNVKNKLTQIFGSWDFIRRRYDSLYGRPTANAIQEAADRARSNANFTTRRQLQETLDLFTNGPGGSSLTPQKLQEALDAVDNALANQTAESLENAKGKLNEIFSADPDGIVVPGENRVIRNADDFLNYGSTKRAQIFTESFRESAQTLGGTRSAFEIYSQATETAMETLRNNLTSQIKAAGWQYGDEMLSMTIVEPIVSRFRKGTPAAMDEVRQIMFDYNLIEDSPAGEIVDRALNKVNTPLAKKADELIGTIQRVTREATTASIEQATKQSAEVVGKRAFKAIGKQLAKFSFVFEIFIELGMKLWAVYNPNADDDLFVDTSFSFAALAKGKPGSEALIIVDLLFVAFDALAIAISAIFDFFFYLDPKNNDHSNYIVEKVVPASNEVNSGLQGYNGGNGGYALYVTDTGMCRIRSSNIYGGNGGNGGKGSKGEDGGYYVMPPQKAFYLSNIRNRTIEIKYGFVPVAMCAIMLQESWLIQANTNDKSAAQSKGERIEFVGSGGRLFTETSVTGIYENPGPFFGTRFDGLNTGFGPVSPHSGARTRSGGSFGSKEVVSSVNGENIFLGYFDNTVYTIFRTLFQPFNQIEPERIKGITGDLQIGIENGNILNNFKCPDGGNGGRGGSGGNGSYAIFTTSRNLEIKNSLLIGGQGGDRGLGGDPGDGTKNRQVRLETFYDGISSFKKIKSTRLTYVEPGIKGNVGKRGFFYGSNGFMILQMGGKTTYVDVPMSWTDLRQCMNVQGEMAVYNCSVPGIPYMNAILAPADKLETLSTDTYVEICKPATKNMLVNMMDGFVYTSTKYVDEGTTLRQEAAVVRYPNNLLKGYEPNTSRNTFFANNNETHLDTVNIVQKRTRSLNTPSSVYNIYAPSITIVRLYNEFTKTFLRRDSASATALTLSGQGNLSYDEWYKLTCFVRVPISGTTTRYRLQTDNGSYLFSPATATTDIFLNTEQTPESEWTLGSTRISIRVGVKSASLPQYLGVDETTNAVSMVNYDETKQNAKWTITIHDSYNAEMYDLVKATSYTDFTKKMFYKHLKQDVIVSTSRYPTWEFYPSVSDIGTLFSDNQITHILFGVIYPSASHTQFRLLGGPIKEFCGLIFVNNSVYRKNPSTNFIETPFMPYTSQDAFPVIVVFDAGNKESTCSLQIDYGSGPRPFISGEVLIYRDSTAAIASTRNTLIDTFVHILPVTKKTNHELPIRSGVVHVASNDAGYGLPVTSALVTTSMVDDRAVKYEYENLLHISRDQQTVYNTTNTIDTIFFRGTNTTTPITISNYTFRSPIELLNTRNIVFENCTFSTISLVGCDNITLRNSRALISQINLPVTGALTFFEECLNTTGTVYFQNVEAKNASLFKRADVGFHSSTIQSLYVEDGPTLNITGSYIHDSFIKNRTVQLTNSTIFNMDIDNTTLRLVNTQGKSVRAKKASTVSTSRTTKLKFGVIEQDDTIEVLQI
jgi:hypothetical protein